MLQFILTTILMLALGTILYLVVRTLPRISGEESGGQTGVLERWLASEIPEKIDAAFKNFMHKSLRKLKVSVLKFDNVITKRLEKVKPENGNGKQKIDFNEINGEKVAKDDESNNNQSA